MKGLFPEVLNETSRKGKPPSQWILDQITELMLALPYTAEQTQQAVAGLKTQGQAEDLQRQLWNEKDGQRSREIGRIKHQIEQKATEGEGWAIAWALLRVAQGIENVAANMDDGSSIGISGDLSVTDVSQSLDYIAKEIGRAADAMERVKEAEMEKRRA
jgi:hypothetical protein